MLARIERSMDILAKALLVIGCIALALMMFHVTADVTMRYVFNRPIIGTPETVAYYYMVFAVFLPLAFVERRGEHIRVDLFTQMMPQRVQLLLYLLACTLGLIFFGMLGYQSYLDALRATTRGETIMSNFLFYIWPARWALPIGFGGIVLALIVNMIRALRLGRAL
ncbi:MAG: TRAP transporter small permease [Salinarimonas sp.]|nr:TRAP transporter small permease [Salinarimonas sp.]